MDEYFNHCEKQRRSDDDREIGGRVVIVGFTPDVEIEKAASRHCRRLVTIPAAVNDCSLVSLVGSGLNGAGPDASVAQLNRLQISRRRARYGLLDREGCKRPLGAASVGAGSTPRR